MFTPAAASAEKNFAVTPGMGAHPHPDHRHLADLVVVEHVGEADRGLDRVQTGHRGRPVGLGQGEGDVGPRGGDGRLVLHDHVDVDLRRGDRLEDPGRLAHLVGHADDGDLGLAAVVRDAGDDRLLHLASFLELLDPGAVPIGERGAHVHPDVLAPRVLHTAQMQDLGPAGRHLQHLLVADVRDPPRAGHDPRVGGVDAVDVGVDLAVVRAQRRGQGHRGGVGGPAAQGGDVLGVLGDPLEPGHDHDVALVQGGGDPAGGDVDDPGIPVRAGGDDARLRAGQRAGVHPLVMDRHGQQRRAHPLAGGQQHVQLAGRRERGDLEGEIHQLVGGVPHGGDDDHDVVTLLLGGDDPLGDALDAVRIRDRRAAVLLHYPAHAVSPRLRWSTSSGLGATPL